MKHTIAARRGDQGLSPRHLDELEESTISPELAARAGLYTEERTSRLGITQRSLVFPYFVPGQRKPIYFREKPDRPRKSTVNASESGSSLAAAFERGRRQGPKYLQPAGVPTGIYFPPGLRASGELSGNEALIWTEGEKKTLALERLGYAAIGAPGIWNFHDKAHYHATGKRELRLHPWILEHVRVCGRHHVICFDRPLRRNGQPNPEVERAATRLAGMLHEAGAQTVWIVEWPDGSVAVDDELARIAWRRKEEVSGIDDVAYQLGDELAHELLHRAAPWGQESVGIPDPIVMRYDLTFGVRLAFGVLLGLADSEGVVRDVDQRELQRRTGLAERTLRRAIRSLEEAALITTWQAPAEMSRDDRWEAASLVYRITDPAQYRGEVHLPIHPEAVPQGALETLLYGILRLAGVSLTGSELAGVLGASEGAVRASLRALSTAGLVRVAHGRAWIA